MREIKFRAWCPDKSRMFIVTEIRMYKTETIGDNSFLGEDCYSPGDLRSSILMQYTGLKDKNGKEIYYDDIYEHSRTMCTVTELVVANWIIDEDRMNKPMDRVEILGNIYENPELLEGEK